MMNGGGVLDKEFTYILPTHDGRKYFTHFIMYVYKKRAVIDAANTLRRKV